MPQWWRSLVCTGTHPHVVTPRSVATRSVCRTGGTAKPGAQVLRVSYKQCASALLACSCHVHHDLCAGLDQVSRLPNNKWLCKRCLVASPVNKPVCSGCGLPRLLAMRQSPKPDNADRELIKSLTAKELWLDFSKPLVPFNETLRDSEK